MCGGRRGALALRGPFETRWVLLLGDSAGGHRYRVLEAAGHRRSWSVYLDDLSTVLVRCMVERVGGEDTGGELQRYVRELYERLLLVIGERAHGGPRDGKTGSVHGWPRRLGRQ